MDLSCTTIHDTLFITEKFSDGISEVNCYKWNVKRYLLVQVTVKRFAPLVISFERKKVHDPVIEISIVENAIMLFPFLARTEAETCLKKNQQYGAISIMG